MATWVVDSAMPACEDVMMIAAEAASAAIPCGDSISTSPLPRVRMILHPPIYVPAAIATAQETIIQTGRPFSAASEALS